MNSISEFYEVPEDRSMYLYSKLSMALVGDTTDVLEWLRAQRDMELINDNELLLLTYWTGNIIGFMVRP